MKLVHYLKLSFPAVSIILSFCIILLVAQNLSAMEKEIYKIGIPTDKAPYSFTAWSKSGIKLRGAYIDVMTQIAHHMGVEFQYVKSGNPTMMIQLFNEKKIDIIGMTLEQVFPYHIKNLTTIPVGLNMTSWIFVNHCCKTIVCQKDLPGKRVSIIGFEALGLWPYDMLDVSDIFPVQTPLEGLTLLNEGRIHAFIAPSEEIASYIIHKHGFENVRRVGLALRKIPLALSLDREDTRLTGRLLEAIGKTMSSGIIRQIEEKWYGVEFKRSFFEKYSRLVFSVIGFTVLVLGLVVIWNNELKRQVKKITAQYRTSENRSRNLIESSPDMIFVVDRAARIYNMNREAQALMPKGLAKGFLPRLTDMVPPADKKSISLFLETVFSTNRATKELRFKRPDSGYREIDVAATLLPSEPGEEPRACLFARDVTRKNRIERDLVQADRMALIGQMAADIAHEINNPIGIVRANIDVILARGWYTPEAKEFLESCKRNTDRAGKFTKDLLAMARPKDPEMAELNLWELVNATIEIMGAQLKNVTIQKQTRGGPAQIIGDRNLLQQVLVNLLLNAAAATKKVAVPEIKITSCVPSGLDMVCLRIEDNGIGIPKQHLTEIFEPFFTQGKKEGFGLGLFISKRIIENHNGMIYAESEVGVGTQMVIELPLIITDPFTS